MARKNYEMTERTYARFATEGRGRGAGEEYRPWLRVDDVPSRGRSHRVFCPLTGRIHHFLSDTEFLNFHQRWWAESGCDLREQFPLPRAETLSIAARQGTRHPVGRTTGTPQVQTTDLLETRIVDGGVTLHAYAVKVANDLSERSLAKLDIERTFWLERGVPWSLVLDDDVKTKEVRNIAWVRGALLPRVVDPRPVGETLLRFMEPWGATPVNRVCLDFDKAHRLEAGRGLSLLRLLLGLRIVETDMSHHRLQQRPATAFAWRSAASRDLTSCLARCARSA